MHSLKISEKLTLPLEAITQTFAIMGIRGSGKTHTATVLAEEMLRAGQPIVVYDPTGAWFGLKTSADGKHAGYPVVIFGGEHPDVPLEEGAGETVAKVIVDRRCPAILDVSLLRKGARNRFMQDFCETLYHRNREALHFFVDEAHTIAPQKPFPDVARLLGAMEDIILQGRRRGLGLTIISQRPALVNTNIRTQCATLVAMRIVGPHDRKAIEEWTDAHGTPERSAQMMESLATLETGEGWVWSVWLDLFKRVKFRMRTTYDSSATPEVGKKLIVPKVVAEIDLAQLGDEIKATVEKAKENDPRELRRRIAELERQLRERPAVAPERIEVPVLKNGQLEKALTIVTKIETASNQFREMAGGLVEAIGQATKPASRAPSPTSTAPADAAQHRRVTEPTPTRIAEPGGIAGNGVLGRCERAILTALAQYPRGRSMVQIALLTQYSVTSGGFKNSLGKLRSANFITRDHPIRITQDGLAALGEYTPLPTGEELRRHWLNELPKCEKAVLSALTAVYPEGLLLDNLAERTGYSRDSGGFKNALGRLRTLELITRSHPIRASEELFQ